MDVCGLFSNSLESISFNHSLQLHSRYTMVAGSVFPFLWETLFLLGNFCSCVPPMYSFISRYFNMEDVPMSLWTGAIRTAQRNSGRDQNCDCAPNEAVEVLPQSAWTLCMFGWRQTPPIQSYQDQLCLDHLFHL